MMTTQSINAAAAVFWKDRKDLYQLWLDAALELADRTEELLKAGYPIGAANMPGDRFKALRVALAGVKKATEVRRAIGAESLKRLRTEADAILEKNPRLSHKALAERIHARDIKRPSEKRIGLRPGYMAKLLSQPYPSRRQK